MAPDATRVNVFNFARGGHQEMEPPAQAPARRRPAPQPLHHDVQPLPPRYNAQPLPPCQNSQPQPVHQRHRDYLLGINPVLDLGVYSAIGIRSGYRMVMGKSGSRRRKVAKAGAVVGGGILVAKVIL